MEVRSIEAIARCLNEAEVKYLVVGGLAVNAHGYVRMTRDVDLVIQLDEPNILAALRALASIGYQMSIPARPEDFAHAATRESWREKRNMIVLKLWSDSHGRTPVDVFVYEPFPFADELARAQSMNLPSGISVPVVSLETLLHMKHEAGRPQDLVDITELTRVP